jgi:flagellar motor switch protein FliM
MSDVSEQPKTRAIEKMVRQRPAAGHERYPLLDRVFENLALGMWSAVRRVLGDGAEVAWEASSVSRFADYCEAVEPSSVFGICRLVEWDGEALITMGAPLVDAAVEALLGGGHVASATPGPRAPTMVDQAIAGRFIRLAIDELARAFVRTDQGTGPLTAKLLKVESNARLLTVARRDEMVVKASFQVVLGPDERGGGFDLLLPYATLEPVRRNLLCVAPPGRRQVDEAASSPLLSVLPQTPVALHAVVDRLKLSLAEIAEWRPGTLLPLGVDAERPTIVYGDKEESPGLGRKMFVGRLGASQGRKAVRVIEVIPAPAETTATEVPS